MNSSNKQNKLKIRKKISQKRPKFSQFESWRYIRIKDHWRRPKGIDNKMRQKRRGWPKTVNIGYRSPKAIRGFHPSGKEEVMIFNIGDLSIVDPDTQIARIGGTVGKKKKIAIVREAIERDIKVLNPGEGTGDIDLEDKETEDTEIGDIEERNVKS